MRKDVVRRIKNVIHTTWSAAKVETFGSYRVGLYLPTSDIDLVIFGEWSNPPFDNMKRRLIESGICRESEIKVLHHARVPIIKLVDSKTNIKVDISFNMENGIRTVHFIESLMEKYPHLRHLVLVLKQFLLLRDLNEPCKGGIGSYCLLLMVVSFLQMREPSYVAPNLGTLLIEFFALYGVHFNYHRTGLRINNGGEYVDKRLMKSMDRSYKRSSLCIEDPLDQSNNVGRSSHRILQIKSAFKHAYDILQAHISWQRYSTGEKDDSILGSIVHVPEDVQKYRSWVREEFPLPSSSCTGSDDVISESKGDESDSASCPALSATTCVASSSIHSASESSMVSSSIPLASTANESEEEEEKRRKQRLNRKVKRSKSNRGTKKLVIVRHYRRRSQRRTRYMILRIVNKKN